MLSFQHLKPVFVPTLLCVRRSLSQLRFKHLLPGHRQLRAVQTPHFDLKWRPSCPLVQFRATRSAANLEMLNSNDTDVNERTVFVGGLNALSDEEALKKYFSSFGEVEGTAVVRTIRAVSKCFGFVRFKDVVTVDRVIDHGHVIEEFPVNVLRAKKYRVVYVGGLPSNVTSVHLKQYFTKFGTVEQVEIPETAETNQRRGYALVTFSTQREAFKATEDESQTMELGTTGAKTDLSVKLYSLAKCDMQTNRLIVNQLPYETTAEEIKDFFEKMGSLKAVDLAMNAKLRKCVAFLTFRSNKDVDDIASKDEIMFNGTMVSVHKADAQSKLQCRSRSLFIENLPLDITENELTAYFMTFGKVRRVSLPLDKDTNHHMGFGVVKFVMSLDLNRVMSYGSHVIGTHKISVRRLALIIPPLSQMPINSLRDE